jgi:ketosteroid isomerase-like protein
MKKLIIATILLAFFPLLATAQNSNTINDKTNVILKLISDWDDVYLEKDATPLDHLLADDFIGIDNDGEVTHKADEIALVKSGEYILLSVKPIEPHKVRFYGPTAIVTSYSNVQLKYKGKETNFIGRATTVCTQKKGGQWEIVSWHASKAEKKP